MTSREKELSRMALVFLISNLDEFLDACDYQDSQQVEFQGEYFDRPTEEELAELLKVLQ